MKLVSVIIPVFNMEKYIKNCLISIMQQEYTNLEIVVVSDGSSDSTETIVKELQKSDQRIKLIKQYNMGSGPARNNGLENSNGDYIFFVDRR